MHHDAELNIRTTLREIAHQVVRENVAELVSSLRQASLDWLSDQVEVAQHSPDLMRELFRLWVMKPNDENDPQVKIARTFFGWKSAAKTFDGLRPEFLDIIYLLPPREYAFIESLAPLLAHQMDAAFPSENNNSDVKTLLDVGTGTGLAIDILLKANLVGESLGIEPASSLADFASRRFTDHPTVEIVKVKIQNYEREYIHFQMAFCYMVLHHLRRSEFEIALRRIFRALADGGLLVYTDKLCGSVGKKGEYHPLDFASSPQTVQLKSGNVFDIQPAELHSTQSFQPHPSPIDEYIRTYEEAAEALFKTGFLIQTAKPLTEQVMLFVCRKPHTKIWEAFAEKPSPAFKPALSNAVQKLEEAIRASEDSKKRGEGTADQPKSKGEKVRGKTPYNWTFDILQALYEDVAGVPCPPVFVREDKGFLRGIAYFSWEAASRLFLVRRAVPFDFHVLSYSHVHDGWGTLGRMVEDFERNPPDYVVNQGYSCLTRDAVQRTLPFQGDISQLNYQAAMAVPIYSQDVAGGHHLRGAFLLYLARPEYVPIRTGSSWQEQLVEKFQELNKLMNEALNAQEKLLEVVGTSATICDKWRSLAAERSDLVIAQLEIRIKMPKRSSPAISVELSKICSNVQALLSGGERFSVLDDREIANGKAFILVAGRFRVSYDEIQEKILTAVGLTAAGYGPFFYKCTQLGT